MKLTLSGRTLTLHYLCVVGSTLHQLNGENSDLDCKGVFTWDKDTINGLSDYPDTLDNKNMSKEDRDKLLSWLNEQFNMTFDNDLDLFLARKFFKNAMKSEPNMLDMLHADKHEGMVLFCDDRFAAVLKARNDFVVLKQARQRFLGMSFNTFKLGAKEGGRVKDLAKSLQSLYSFKNLVEDGEHNPVLKPSQKSEVQAVKFNTYFMEHDKLADLVNETRKMLEEECNELELEEKEHNFVMLNNLLLSLS